MLLWVSAARQEVASGTAWPGVPQLHLLGWGLVTIATALLGHPGGTRQSFTVHRSAREMVWLQSGRRERPGS